MTERRKRVRAVFALVLATGVAVLGAVACQGGAVIIGIESTGIESDDGSAPANPGAAPSAPSGLDEPDANLGEPAQPSDDAGLRACLPDGGCPYEGKCEYPDDAACGTPGVCFSGAPPVVPPGGGPIAPPRRRLEGYTETPPVCDGGNNPAAPSASDADLDAEDAPGD